MERVYEERKNPWRILGVDKKDEYEDIVREYLKALSILMDSKEYTKKAKKKYKKELTWAFNHIMINYFPHPDIIEHKQIKYVKLDLGWGFENMVQIVTKVRIGKVTVKGIIEANIEDPDFNLYLERNNNYYATYNIDFNRGKWVHESLDSKSRAMESFDDLDPWKVLGLKPGSSKKEIEKAYRKMVRKWHPDRNKDPEATERMKEINWAHDVLSGKIPKKQKRSKSTPNSPVPDFISSGSIKVMGKIKLKSRVIVASVRYEEYKPPWKRDAAYGEFLCKLPEFPEIKLWWIDNSSATYTYLPGKAKWKRIK